MKTLNANANANATVNATSTELLGLWDAEKNLTELAGVVFLTYTRLAYFGFGEPTIHYGKNSIQFKLEDEFCRVSVGLAGNVLSIIGHYNKDYFGSSLELTEIVDQMRERYAPALRYIGLKELPFYVNAEQGKRLHITLNYSI